MAGKHYFMGQEKEPPAQFGKYKGRRNGGGKHPPVHSHSARPKRTIKAGGRKRG